MNERANHTYEAAQLYYIHNMTMDAIAARLGVSRATVSRLLKSARESGMVQIRLDDSFRTRSELERRIGERYKVRVTLVNVRPDATPIARMSQVSRTAA
ncbi:MAG: sigma factor-like helix-turn-helix DNA-binding protein, partial [Rothia mucilaginosa]